MDDSTKIAIVGVIGSIIGGAVGGLLAIWASYIATAKAFNDNLRLQKQSQNETIRGVILGIQTEINLLKAVYESEYSIEEIKSLEAGKPFNSYYPIHQNYLTVYEANASYIGQIPDDELRSLIIEIYLRIKGLIDTHILNNELFKEVERLEGLNSQKQVVLEIPFKTDLAKKALNDYGINIKVNYELLVEKLDKFNPKADAVIQMLSDGSNTKELNK